MAQDSSDFSSTLSEIKPLRAFFQVSRLGSVSQAARALALSQPAVTLQVQALERSLGLKLFDRSGRRLTLSREGEVFYELARPLVEGLEGLDGAFRARLDALDAETLDIAAGNSSLLYLLPGIVEAFRERHPGVNLRVRQAGGEDGLDLLRSERVDFAVGSLLEVPADLEYAPAYNFEPMLIAPPEHALADKPSLRLEDLSAYGLILPPQRMTSYRMIDLVFQRARVSYTVALEVMGWEVIKQCVAMGLGISIVTAVCLTDTDRERLAVRSLATHFPSRSYGVIKRRGKRLSAQARAFVELLGPNLFAQKI